MKMPPPFLLMLFSCCCFYLFFVAVYSIELPLFERIPDAEVEEDMKAAERAIQSPWVEQFPAGLKRMATKQESFSLTDAQRALFNRHWELETIQKEKPTRPKQFDLEMFVDALKTMLEMDEEKKVVLIWPHKLREWMEIEKLRGGEKKMLLEEAEEAKTKSAQLANLIDSEEESVEGEEEGQCSAADKPAEIVLAEQQAKMANAIASNQRMIAQQIPTPSAANIVEQPPSMAPSPIQAAIQQGNYMNKVDDFGRPMVLIIGGQNNMGRNGLEGKLGETIQQKKQQNVAEQKRKPIILNDGSKIYIVQEEGEAIGNNRKEGNEIGQEKVDECCDNADEDKKDENKEEENDGNKGKFDDEDKEKEGKKVEENKKMMENEKSSEEEANEKTIFETIRGQKTNEDNVKEKEDGNDEGRILIIDWAKVGGEGGNKEDEEEDEERNGDNVGAISKRLGAMKMIKVGEEANSAEEEQKLPKSNANVVEVEVTKPDEMKEKPGLLTILSDMLFARKKRDVIMMEGESNVESLPKMSSPPIPAIILEENKLEEQMPTKMPFKMPIAPAGVFANETISENDREKEEDENSSEEVEKENVGETIKMVRNFKGRVSLGKGQFGISAKWEMTMNTPSKQQKQMEEVKKETAVGVQEKKTINGDNVEKVEEKQLKNKEKFIKVSDDKKAELVAYLEGYLFKTGVRKRAEKLAYVLYSELQYWLAKQIEKKFERNEKENLNQILGEAYLRAKWSNTIKKLAILTNWIGRDFRKK